MFGGRRVARRTGLRTALGAFPAAKGCKTGWECRAVPPGTEVPRVSGQGSNRIFTGKDWGSNVGGQASEGNERCSGFTFAYTMRARSSAAPGRPIRTSSMSSSVSSRHRTARPARRSRFGGRSPGAAFLSPGEVIDVRLEDIQDSSAPRFDGHRPARPQRPQPGRDLVGEFLIVFRDQQRGCDLLRIGGQLRVPEEQFG